VDNHHALPQSSIHPLFLYLALMCLPYHLFITPSSSFYHLRKSNKSININQRPPQPAARAARTRNAKRRRSKSVKASSVSVPGLTPKDSRASSGDTGKLFLPLKTQNITDTQPGDVLRPRSSQTSTKQLRKRAVTQRIWTPLTALRSFLLSIRKRSVRLWSRDMLTMRIGRG
jgi:hypothetical protein